MAYSDDYFRGMSPVLIEALKYDAETCQKGSIERKDLRSRSLKAIATLYSGSWDEGHAAVEELITEYDRLTAENEQLKQRLATLTKNAP